MAWTKASLKLVFQTDEQKEDMTYKTKSKTFSNLKQSVAEQNCKNVAKAIEGVQKYTLTSISRIDYTDIEL